jgi:hypothetical protein
MIGKGKSMMRASSLALLCLFAHALFVCVTHLHDSPAAAVSITAAGDNSPGGASDSRGDAHCPSCRLQSNFISDSHTGSLIIEPTVQSLACEVRLAEPPSRYASLLIFGRAPPIA